MVVIVLLMSLPERRAKGAFRYCDPKMTELNKADLERVRTCINRGILESTVLTTIRARNEAFLQKKCSKNVTFEKNYFAIFYQ